MSLTPRQIRIAGYIAETVGEERIRALRGTDWTEFGRYLGGLIDPDAMEPAGSRDDEFDDLEAMFSLPSPQKVEPIRRSARRSGVRIPIALRAAVIARDGMVCRHCAKTVYWPADGIKWGDTLQLDHVTPVAKGGEDTFENLVVSCATCNLLRSDSGLPIGQYPKSGAA